MSVSFGVSFRVGAVLSKMLTGIGLEVVALCSTVDSAKQHLARGGIDAVTVGARAIAGETVLADINAGVAAMKWYTDLFKEHRAGEQSCRSGGICCQRTPACRVHDRAVYGDAREPAGRV